VAGYRLVVFESSHIALKLLTSHTNTALFAAQALGAIVLASAFVESRRTPPAGTGSICGP
jgi:hypothetical protein